MSSSEKHKTMLDTILAWARDALAEHRREGEPVETTRLVVWDPEDLDIQLLGACAVEGLRVLLTTAARVVHELARVGVPSGGTFAARVEPPTEQGWLLIITLVRGSSQVWEIALPHANDG